MIPLFDMIIQGVTETADLFRLITGYDRKPSPIWDNNIRSAKKGFPYWKLIQAVTGRAFQMIMQSEAEWAWIYLETNTGCNRKWIPN